MWQKCPVCNGTGKSIEIFSGESCKACNSKGIISSVTGLPPNGIETFASPKYRNSDGTPVIGEWDNIPNNSEKIE